MWESAALPSEGTEMRRPACLTLGCGAKRRITSVAHDISRGSIAVRRRSSTTIVRTVPATKDYISFKGRSWIVPRAFRGERVAIRPLTADGEYGVFFASHQISTIDLTNNKCVGDVSEQV
jgi:hypothetical protein